MTCKTESHSALYQEIELLTRVEDAVQTMTTRRWIRPFGRNLALAARSSMTCGLSPVISISPVGKTSSSSCAVSCSCLQADRALLSASSLCLRNSWLTQASGEMPPASKPHRSFPDQAASPCCPGDRRSPAGSTTCRPLPPILHVPRLPSVSHIPPATCPKLELLAPMLLSFLPLSSRSPPMAIRFA
jgi:hypothetical protein